MTQTITLHLPEDIYQRLQQAAATTHQPLETVLFQTIQGNLPPVAGDLPPELAEELSVWQTVSDAALWQIVNEPLPAVHWQRHQALLRRNAAGRLSASEQAELPRLRATADQFALRRSYALALLKWRGHTLPAPETLSLHATPQKNIRRRSAKSR